VCGEWGSTLGPRACTAAAVDKNSHAGTETDRHTMTAYTTLAWRRAVKMDIIILNLTLTEYAACPKWGGLHNCRVFASDPKGRGFKSLPVRFQVTALGKLFTRV